MIELRPYQVEVGAAVMRSIEGRKGYTFTVEMARQAGKNELSAQLEMLLLAANAARGGQGVKASPTFKPQTLNSIQRLKDRLLDNGLRSATQTRFSYQVALGRATWLFFSAEPTANVVGATATLLLEGDEAQDIDVEKWQRDFRPMGATANVTTILYGTAWADDSLLEQQKQTNLELARRDGEQRHFEYPWDVIAQYNPDYKTYVEGERDRLGPDHPLFVTQYELRPLSYLGRMFTAAQLDVMRAGFGVSSDPDGSVHIAGLDIAGAAESIEDPEQILAGHSDRDSTVLSIGAVRAGQLHVVRTYEWIGVPHFQASAEAAALCRHWKVRAVYADATGLGAPVVETLARPRMLGKVVVPYVFTAPSKSALAYNLLSLVGRGGLRLHFGFPEHYWGQLRTARTQVRPNKSMNFYVDERDGHDDFLMSLALLAQAYADLVPARQAVGRLP